MTYREVLRELADYQYGYITTTDAQEADIPAVELRKLAARGGLEHVARGVYRFPDARHTPEAEYAEAVMRVGRDAVLAGESVLALHNLALVGPRQITVATPHRVRLTDPGRVRVIQRQFRPDEITEYAGIPATRVWRALVDVIGRVMTDRLRAALAEAVRKELVTPAEAARVRRALNRATVAGHRETP
jgi:predicted transcriptional regulator of viral defense system